MYVRRTSRKNGVLINADTLCTLVLNLVTVTHILLTSKLPAILLRFHINFIGNSQMPG